MPAKSKSLHIAKNTIVIRMRFNNEEDLEEFSSSEDFKKVLGIIMENAYNYSGRVMSEKF